MKFKRLNVDKNRLIISRAHYAVPALELRLRWFHSSVTNGKFKESYDAGVARNRDGEPLNRGSQRDPLVGTQWSI